MNAVSEWRISAAIFLSTLSSSFAPNSKHTPAGLPENGLSAKASTVYMRKDVDMLAVWLGMNKNCDGTAVWRKGHFVFGWKAFRL